MRDVSHITCPICGETGGLELWKEHPAGPKDRIILPTTRAKLPGLDGPDDAWGDYDCKRCESIILCFNPARQRNDEWRRMGTRAELDAMMKEIDG